MFVKLTATLLGLVGVFLLLLGSPFGCILPLVGALLFLWQSRQERDDLEERRHREMVDAMRSGQGGGNQPSTPKSDWERQIEEARRKINK